MRERPIGDLMDALNQLGVEMEAKNNCPPVEIFAKGLPGGKTKIAGDISSQFLSALLMVAPYAQSEIEITLSTELNSKPYVDMTIAIMKEFGVEIERHGYELFYYSQFSSSLLTTFYVCQIRVRRLRRLLLLRRSCHLRRDSYGGKYFTQVSCRAILAFWMCFNKWDAL